MFEQENFEELVGKTYKLTQKFKFEEARGQVTSMIDYLKAESANVQELGDIEDWSNRPDPVLWLNKDAKGSEVRSQIEALKTELKCDCKPVSCKCDPTESAKPNPKLKCKFCAEPLINSGNKWLPSKNYAICHLCKEVLFDVFYTEQRAAEKINEVLESATWWTRGDRPQFTKALELLTDAKNWCGESSTLPNAAK